MQPMTTAFRRHARVGLEALGLALLALALLVTMAAAHALLVKSEPEDGAVLEQSPQQAVAWFSEELNSDTSGMRVFDSQGRQVDQGDGGVDLNDLDHTSMIVSMPPALPTGTYTVRWAAASAEDDDATEGEFTFSVGSGVTVQEPAMPAPGASSKWLIAGVVAGLVLLLLVVLAWVWRRQSAGREA